MKEKKRCSRCVLPETFPKIKFDKYGVCNYCHMWDFHWKNFDYEKSEKELINIFRIVKQKNAKYDCLIPFSGGRDSSYVLYLASEKYGLNPLAVTFNNGFMSSYALKNIFSAIKRLGVDHIFDSYNWNVLKSMYATMVSKVGEFCSICSIGIRNVICKYQQLYKIPIVLNGISSRVDERSPFEVITSHPNYVRNVLRGNVDNKDVEDFIIPDQNDWSTMKIVFAKIFKKDYFWIQLPDYICWNNDVIQQTLETELNWQTPDKKADHIDCRFTKLKYFLKEKQMPGAIFKEEKFSQLIRDGQMEREEALRQLHKYVIDLQKTPDNLDDFLQLLGLDMTALDGIEKLSHLYYIKKEDTIKEKSIAFLVLSLPWKLKRWCMSKLGLGRLFC